MTREIKFRAWGNHENKMGEVNFIKYSNVQYTQVSVRFKKKERVIDEWFNFGSEDGSDNVILMQYTGLKDKNGKEIYEGDIVAMDIHYKPEHPKKVGAVRFINGHFEVFYNPNSNTKFVCGYPEEYEPDSEWEVIGNIYENPHLLEGAGT